MKFLVRFKTYSLKNNQMFGLLINITSKDTEQFTEDSLFAKYGIKYQLYSEWQRFLMGKIREMHNSTWKIVSVDMTGGILYKEFWELNMAKYMYMMDRDPGIVKHYGQAWYDEMIEQLT